MGVKRYTFWKCDLCRFTQSEVEVPDLYDDPVVTPPEGWAMNAENNIVCPKCNPNHEETE